MAPMPFNAFTAPRASPSHNLHDETIDPLWTCAKTVLTGHQNTSNKVQSHNTMLKQAFGKSGKRSEPHHSKQLVPASIHAICVHDKQLCLAGEESLTLDLGCWR